MRTCGLGFQFPLQPFTTTFAFVFTGAAGGGNSREARILSLERFAAKQPLLEHRPACKLGSGKLGQLWFQLVPLPEDRSDVF